MEKHYRFRWILFWKCQFELFWYLWQFWCFIIILMKGILNVLFDSLISNEMLLSFWSWLKLPVKNYNTRWLLQTNLRDFSLTATLQESYPVISSIHLNYTVIVLFSYFAIWLISFVCTSSYSQFIYAVWWMAILFLLVFVL